MTAVDDLVAFLRQQLDRQRAAIIAYRDHRAGLTPCDSWNDYDSCSIHIATAAASEYSDVDYGLAEVKAKRRILDEHDPSPTTKTCCPTCRDYDEPVQAPCPTVRLLAQPYAGRPGWRAEWAA